MQIGIAGAGGIGSNVARHLAQAGVRRLKIVDFDQVEATNLNRQFFRLDQVGRPKVDCLTRNLSQISSQLEITALSHRLAPKEAKEIFADCQVVVEGFDDPVAKKHLVEELLEEDIPLVCASGIAGRDLGSIRTKRVGTSRIIGDFTTDVKDADLFPPKIAMIAALMAAEVLDLIEPGRGGKKHG